MLLNSPVETGPNNFLLKHNSPVILVRPFFWTEYNLDYIITDHIALASFAMS